jgi:hypothetical protein
MSRAAALQPCALLRGAEQADRAGAEPLHGEGEICEAVMPGEHLAGETERADVEHLAFRCGSRPEPAVATEPGDEVAAGGVDIAVIDGEIARAPSLQPVREIAVAILEKRPGQEIAVHQSPLNTGFSFATNA